LISVVTGTLNRLNYLKSMIASVEQALDGIKHEIIVVDGGSTDGTIEWLWQSNVVLIEQGKKLGAVRAFNAGFAMARFPFVFNANDDILVHGDLFREALVQMREPNVAQVAVPYGKAELETTCAYVKLGKSQNYYLYGNFALTRRDIGDKLGWWSDYYHYAGDAELSARIWEAGYLVEKLNGKGWIEHLEVQDATRVENTDSKRFYEKWKDWNDL
jgi:GT2 family glycosyltransferase